MRRGARAPAADAARATDATLSGVPAGAGVTAVRAGGDEAGARHQERPLAEDGAAHDLAAGPAEAPGAGPTARATVAARAGRATGERRTGVHVGGARAAVATFAAGATGATGPGDTARATVPALGLDPGLGRAELAFDDEPGRAGGPAAEDHAADHVAAQATVTGPSALAARATAPGRAALAARATAADATAPAVPTQAAGPAGAAGPAVAAPAAVPGLDGRALDQRVGDREVALVVDDPALHRPTVATPATVTAITRSPTQGTVAAGTTRRALDEGDEGVVEPLGAPATGAPGPAAAPGAARTTVAPGATERPGVLDAHRGEPDGAGGDHQRRPAGVAAGLAVGGRLGVAPDLAGPPVATSGRREQRPRQQAVRRGRAAPLTRVAVAGQAGTGPRGTGRALGPAVAEGQALEREPPAGDVEVPEAALGVEPDPLGGTGRGGATVDGDGETGGDLDGRGERHGARLRPGDRPALGHRGAKGRVGAVGQVRRRPRR